MKKRPNGEGLLLVALLLGLGGFFLIAYGYTSRRLSDGTWIIVGGGLFSVGILSGLTAAIVRALWFLPGEDKKPD